MKAFKTTTLSTTVLLALALVASGSVPAQERGREGDGPDKGEVKGEAKRDEPRKDAHPPASPKRAPAPVKQARGAGPDHNFRRGGRLPDEYRDQRYYVSDWRSHHLSAPPRGYQWVQTGSDFVLVAVATGVIASVLLGH
jgi:Ni/Co efflux regulator RcnB